MFSKRYKNLDEVDADANKKKKQIVQDLAKDLEGKIRTDRISAEIVHQLHGNGVSERLIRKCLDEKYKEKHRAANTRKQRTKHTEDLAASVPLEQEKPQQQIAVTQDGKSVIINEIPNDANASSDVVDRIHDESNQNGVAEPKKESTIMPSLNNATQFPMKQTKDLTDTKKEVFVSHIPMLFEALRKDMAIVFQTTKGIGNIFFKVSVDLGKHVTEIECCGITQHKDVAMTSVGKGELKEA